VIVADTSAWVELLRATESRAHRTLRRLINACAPLAVTEMVVGEVLAGARSAPEAEALRNELTHRTMLPLHGLLGFEAAAALARHCRTRGISASLADCLVAVPAIWAGASVLHADADFDAIATVSPLEVQPLDEDPA
jgi:predicted nucleic acid-binding protein